MAKQHVNIYQKSLLRRSLALSSRPGPAYVPFIGDGDLALKHYADRFDIFGADIDDARVETARARLPGHTVVKADCNGWPFPGHQEPFVLADFDAYSEPYPSFRAFWEQALKADPLVLIFTDGHLQGIKRNYILHHPSGEVRPLATDRRKPNAEDRRKMRRVLNFYWQRTIKPWFRDYIAPWRIQRTKFYIRPAKMLYWGAIITRAKS